MPPPLLNGKKIILRHLSSYSKRKFPDIYASKSFKNPLRPLNIIILKSPVNQEYLAKTLFLAKLTALTQHITSLTLGLAPYKTPKFEKKYE